MSVRLSVVNLPSGLDIDKFRAPFSELRGFKNASFVLDFRNQPIGGIIEFTSYEFADYAKKLMQSYRFQGSTSGIVIEFLREEQNQAMGKDTTNLGSTQFGVNSAYTQQNQQQPSNFQAQNTNSLINPQKYQQNYNNMSINQGSLQAGQQGLTGYDTQFQAQPQIQNLQTQGLDINTINSVQTQQHHQAQQQQTGLAFNQNVPANQLGQVNLPYHQNLAQPQTAIIAPPNPMVMGLPNFPVATDAILTNSLMQLLNNEKARIFKVSNDATNCLYVDGIPIDAKEREVAHVFRPYPGYQTARLITKEAKNGRKFYYCFVDFDSNSNASICKDSLQGYRFHKKDKKGLKVSYATPTNLVMKRRRRSRSRSRS